ncbi:hypothetical protein ATKI12_8297 [Kitasatospora sp. Ki12]
MACALGSRARLSGSGSRTGSGSPAGGRPAGCDRSQPPGTTPVRRLVATNRGGTGR